MVYFRQYDPCSALAPYIKCYWTLEHGYLPVQPDNIVPDGCVEMVFHYGDRYVCTIDGKQTEQMKAIVVGQITSAIKLQPTGKTGMFAIRFYPWGLYPFTGCPVDELTNCYCEPDEIFGKDFRPVIEQLLYAAPGSRIQTIERYLLHLLDRQRISVVQQTDKLAPLLMQLCRGSANTSVEDMAYDANLGVRQFNRTINKIVGISPKQLGRIARLQRFFHKYRSSSGQTLTSLLYECGYYDQAHFIRDFKNISGANPTEFFSRENEITELMMR